MNDKIKKTYIAGLSLLLGMILISCSEPEPSLDAPYRGKNVILISIDTCRADFLSPYGSTEVETPAVAQLAQDGILFTQALTPVPMTLPAHTSLFTGLHPTQHKVRDNLNNGLSEAAVTLAELFRENGYQTGGMVGAIILSRRTGISQGFDYFNDEFEPQDYLAMQPTVERKAGRVREIAQDWLTEISEAPETKPFFLFMHFYDPHMAYHPPQPFLQQYKDRPYAGEIAYVDAQLTLFFEYLKTRDLYDDSIMILVADHGEALGEHGEDGHGLFLYEEVMHVPMIMKLPAVAQRQNRRVEQIASLMDIMPTLIDLCGLGYAESAGISLTPWMMGDAEIEPRNLVLETLYPLTFQWSPLFALRNEEWKYVQAPQPELYALKQDPDEERNLITGAAAQASRLKHELEEGLFTLASTSSLDIDPDVTTDRAEALNALGYTASLGITADTASEELPDPKEKLEVYRMIDHGLAAASAGQYQVAVNMFQSAIEKDPENPTSYYNLALVHSNLLNWEQAQQFIEQANQLIPGSLLVQLQRAKILAGQGRMEQAGKVLHEILEEDPRQAEAHFQLGMIARQQQQFQLALEHYQSARKWMPDMPGIEQVIEEIQAYIK
ncbi:MAG: sulfatase-like hydrolase/transferase [bacterium]|jgi:choline-sulfatase